MNWEEIWRQIQRLFYISLQLSGFFTEASIFKEVSEFLSIYFVNFIPEFFLVRIWTLFRQCEVFKSDGWKHNKEYSYSKTQKYLSFFHLSYKLRPRFKNLVNYIFKLDYLEGIKGSKMLLAVPNLRVLLMLLTHLVKN